MQKIILRFEKTLELSYPKIDEIKNPPTYVEGLINSLIMKAYETNPKGYIKKHHDDIFDEQVEKVFDALLLIDNVSDTMPYNGFSPYDLKIKPKGEDDYFDAPFSWEWTVKLESSDLMCIDILPDRTFVIYGKDRELKFYKPGEDVTVTVQEGIDNITIED